MIATNQTALQSAREGVREFFLLEKAEERLAAMDRARLDAVRGYYDAAQRRLNVAQDLRGPVQTPAALALYRQGTHLLALAYLLSRSHTDRDAPAVGQEETLRELDKAIEVERLEVPEIYRRARPILTSSDPLDLDRLTADQAAVCVEDLESMSRWLSSLVELRTPSELKWIRVLRIGMTAIAAIGLLIFTVMRILAPKNLALDKVATGSAGMFSTTPAGIVDGTKNGSFGYHSVLEESPWVSIDLGRPFAITKIKVHGRGDGPFDQAIPLSLEASDDGTTYNQLALRTTGFSESDPWVFQPAGVVTRFLRLKTMRQSYLVLSEVEVNGSAPK